MIVNCIMLLNFLQLEMASLSSFTDSFKGKEQAGLPVSLFLRIYLFLFHMHEYLPRCMCVNYLYTQCLHSPEEGIAALGTGVTGCCEPPGGFWELNTDPLCKSSKCSEPLSCICSLPVTQVNTNFLCHTQPTLERKNTVTCSNVAMNQVQEIQYCMCLLLGSTDLTEGGSGILVKDDEWIGDAG